MSVDPRKEEEHEAQEIQERTSPPGKVVYQAIYREAKHELQRKSLGLAWSGLAAGLSMGFSMLAQAFLRHAIPGSGWEPLLTPLGYTVGFLIVILGRQQLFTENTLTPILPLLNTKKCEVLWNVLRLWGVVLVTNLLGGAIFAVVVARTHVVDQEIRDACVEISRTTLEHGFGTTLLRGIFAGWLIALMIWLLPFAESARVWVIIIISYLIGLGHFPHIIAGGVEAFYLVAGGGVGLMKALTGFVLPTLIGNTIGGVALVAALVHAQLVAAERQELLEDE
ncbi:formate/nitrite transporter family protein [Haloferula sargassicola]|uniref:Inner membrane protein YfdC n=1 Tax=Haloferula sargassicola TaxID=490096 RepID=A0ABP9UKV7_9BACT